MNSRTIELPRGVDVPAIEQWVRTDFFCLGCGKPEVWRCAEEDYYVGAQLICSACALTWHLPDDPYTITGVDAWQAARLTGVRMGMERNDEKD